MGNWEVEEMAKNKALWGFCQYKQISQKVKFLGIFSSFWEIDSGFWGNHQVFGKRTQVFGKGAEHEEKEL